jgi:predicted N-acetyltransferase YhbS
MASMAAADLAIVQAELADVPALVDIINEAYEVETGSTGVSFKHTKRIIPASSDEAELREQVAGGQAFKALQDGDGDRIMGVIVVQPFKDEDTGDDRMYFGPLAVDPAVAGRGVGRALVRFVEARAAAAGCASVDISVVNHRTDILPWYQAKLGYVPVGTGPFPVPDRCTRDCHFIFLRKALKSAGAEECFGGAAQGSTGGAGRPH